MALQKSFERASGVQGDHWEVVSIHMDILGGQMDVRFALFKSKVDFDSRKTQMEEIRSMTIPLPASVTGIITSIFAQAKVQTTSDQQPGDTPFFEGAIDV